MKNETIGRVPTEQNAVCWYDLSYIELVDQQEDDTMMPVKRQIASTK